MSSKVTRKKIKFSSKEPVNFSIDNLSSPNDGQENLTIDFFVSLFYVLTKYHFFENAYIYNVSNHNK